MNLFATLVTAAFATGVAFANEAPPLNTTSASFGGPKKPGAEYFLELSAMSSKSPLKNDFRSLKGSASDDTGSMSESTPIPNLSYLAAVGIFKIEQDHRFVAAALQSAESKDQRTIPTPFGRDFVIPGRILALRYSYALAPSWRLSVGGAHIDVFGFGDPSAGVIYRGRHDGGLSTRLSLDFSAPVNKKSKRDQLITRATARSGIYLRQRNWNVYGRFSHSVPYYREVAPTPSGHSQSSSSHGAGHGSGDGSGKMPSFSDIEEIDLVLADKEVGRTMTGLGGSFSFTDSFSINGNTGITYLQTARGPVIWITNARPLGLAYRVNNLELASNLSLTSDIQNYQRLTLPKLWSVDVALSYSLGQRPRE